VELCGFLQQLQPSSSLHSPEDGASVLGEPQEGPLAQAGALPPTEEGALSGSVPQPGMKCHRYLSPGVPEARGTLPDELSHASAFDLYRAPRLKYLWGPQVRGCLLNLGQGQGKETSGVFPRLTVEIKQEGDLGRQRAHTPTGREQHVPLRKKTRAQS